MSFLISYYVISNFLLCHFRTIHLCHFEISYSVISNEVRNLASFSPDIRFLSRIAPSEWQRGRNLCLEWQWSVKFFIHGVVEEFAFGRTTQGRNMPSELQPRAQVFYSRNREMESVFGMTEQGCNLTSEWRQGLRFFIYDLGMAKRCMIEGCEMESVLGVSQETGSFTFTVHRLPFFVHWSPFFSLITSGPLMASITREAGSPFSRRVAITFRYLRMWRKNFLYPSQR